jgi:hypothetical protein
VHLAHAMLADAASVAEGKLYVHGGGWGELAVDAVPAIYPTFALVFALELDGSEPEGRLRLELTVVSPEAPVASAGGWIDIPPGHGGGSIVNQVTLSAVPLPLTGRYLVRLECDGAELGGVAFDVQARRPPDDDREVLRAMVGRSRRP